MWWFVVGSVVATCLVVLVIVNFLPPEKCLARKLDHLYGIDDAQFDRELSVLLGPPLVAGNHIAPLHNGVRIFPAMLAAIANAERSITFETYIYWSGQIANAFVTALVARARAGVRVHVLLDWVGSLKMEQALIDTMQAAGIEVEKYHPLRWYHLSRMNNRTHRKVLVVDGRLAFTGGVGIADKWDGDAEDPEHWRDEHFRCEGPVVAQMQAVFIDNWIKVTGQVLQGEAYFPELRPLGTVYAQVFSSSPTGGSESMLLMYLLAIASAERSIDLAASYFVPDNLTSPALLAALARGVVIRIIVPGRFMDADMVRMASRARWGPLLESGVMIYEYQPTMYHCKMLIVDSRLVSVGSTNFDNRSFSLNDEASLNVVDPAFAEHMAAVFAEDLRRSKQVTLEAWRHRPLHERIREAVAWPWSSQL